MDMASRLRLALAVGMVVAGCGAPADSDDAPRPDGGVTSDGSADDGGHPVRDGEADGAAAPSGDLGAPQTAGFKERFDMTLQPGFSVAMLEAYDAEHGTDAARWYDEFISADDFSRSFESDFENSLETDGQGPLRVVARQVSWELNGALMALRATGSPVVLDRIHDLMTVVLSYRERKDGYLLLPYLLAPRNWLGSGLEAGLAYGTLAQVAYAFYLNREADPRYDAMYEELADHMRGALEPHLTEGRGYTGGKLFNISLFHPYISMIRYYWYWHLMLREEPGEEGAADAYRAEALRMGEVMLRVMKTAPNGTFVFPHRVWPEVGGGCVESSSDYSCGYHMVPYPAEFAYTPPSLIMDGFPPFAEREVPQKLSRSFRLNLFDGEEPVPGMSRLLETFSGDVGPSDRVPCGDGCRSDSVSFPEVIDGREVTLTYTNSRSENGHAFYAISRGISYLAFWDETGEIADETRQIFEYLDESRPTAGAALLLAYELYTAGDYAM